MANELLLMLMVAAVLIKNIEDTTWVEEIEDIRSKIGAAKEVIDNGDGGEAAYLSSEAAYFALKLEFALTGAYDE